MADITKVYKSLLKMVQIMTEQTNIYNVQTNVYNMLINDYKRSFFSLRQMQLKSINCSAN